MLDSAAGNTGGGKIAWYRFNEEGGTTLSDASPNGRDAGIVAAQDGGTGPWVPTHPGYLGAIPEDAVLRLGPPRWAVYGGTHGFTLRPYYISDTQPVSSYFRRVEPTIGFGSIDTGVPNRKRNDGLPRYDVPVTGIPSPGTDGPTFLDLVWDRAPFLSHAAFVSAVTDIAEAFVAAGVFTAAEKDLVVSHAIQAEQELAPGPTWEVEVQARTRCTGTNVYLAVNAHNAGDVPLTIELVTPYGSRTVTGVAPGQAAYQSFNTRLAAAPAGTVTVNVTGAVDGAPVTTQIEASYGQANCTNP